MARRTAYIIHFDRGSLTDMGTIVGSGVTRNTTSPLSGSADLQIAYPSGAGVTWTCVYSPFGSIVNLTNIPAGSPLRRISIAFPFSFSANPANHANLLSSVNGLSAYISSARKIRYNGVDSSDAALSNSTKYWLNLIIDKDWNSLGNGAILFRVYDSSFSTLLQSLTANVVNPSVAIPSFGEVQLKAQTGPGCNVRIGSSLMLIDYGSSQKAPWLKNPTFEAIRVPQSVGANNDGIGVSQAVNKYLNIDETTVDSSDYVHQGQIGVTERQTFGYGTASYSGRTIRAYNIVHVKRGSAGQSLGGDFYAIENDGTNEYQHNTESITAGVSSPQFYGGDKMPDESALSESGLDSLKSGYYSNYSDSSYGSGQTDTGVPVADSTYNDFTPSTGVNKFAVVDDGATPNDSDYIISTASGHKQGFTFNFNPTPAVLGDTIKKLVFKVRARNNSAGTGSFYRLGCVISGTPYYTPIFLADPSTTTFTNDSIEFDVSTDGNAPRTSNNPSTGNRWQQSELTTTVFFIEHVTKGTGDLYVSNITLGNYNASRIMLETAWLSVVTGDAFEENGNITRGHLLASTGVGS